MAVAFHMPETVEDAIRLKGEDEDALYLAGGQTLVAMMNTELIEPTALISLERIASLSGISTAPDGSVQIGAMTRHAEIAECDQLTAAHTVVKQAGRVIAHPAIRNLGTIGGAVCHGDPNGDFPAALVAADARFQVAGPAGQRDIAASDFFEDFMTTALDDGDLLLGITLPPAPTDSSGHYEKFSRVDGDYATVSVAVALAISPKNKVEWIRIAVGACANKPVRIPSAEKKLHGTDLDQNAVSAAASEIAAACDPIDDVRGSAEYRRLLVPRLVERAVLAAQAGKGA